MSEFDYIEASGDTLMRQAFETAEVYLKNGRMAIDYQFGDGYCEAHPELLAAFMQTAARDFHTATLAKQVRAGLESIAEALKDDGMARDVAEAIQAEMAKNGGVK